MCLDHVLNCQVSLTFICLQKWCGIWQHCHFYVFELCVIWQRCVVHPWHMTDNLACLIFLILQQFQIYWFQWKIPLTTTLFSHSAVEYEEGNHKKCHCSSYGNRFSHPPWWLFFQMPEWLVAALSMGALHPQHQGLLVCLFPGGEVAV